MTYYVTYDAVAQHNHEEYFKWPTVCVEKSPLLFEPAIRSKTEEFDDADPDDGEVYYEHCK